MKKLLCVIVFFLVPLLMIAADYYRVTADVLNVRNQPSRHGDVVGVVKKGDIVEVDANEHEVWVKISTSSVSGYVNSKYLEYSYTDDTVTEQDKDEKPKWTFKRIIGKIIGWLIPILLIILSITINRDEVWDVFEDGTMVKRPSGGCMLFLIGLIWLIIKIYNLF